MVHARDIPDDHVRRRSLLPQRTGVRRVSTSENRLQHVLENPIDRANGQRHPDKALRIQSCVDPKGLPLTQEISRAVSLRGPNTCKPPLPNSQPNFTRLRTKSVEQDSQNISRTSNHGRGISQQTYESTQQRVATTRSTLSQSSLAKSQHHQKPASTAMQRSSAPKRAGILQPSSQSEKSIGEDVALSVDCLKLQMELAQLHLLHRSSQATENQWEQSAEDCYERNFTALLERHAELTDIADQQHALLNQLALVRWSKNKSGSQIAENVALFSQNIGDVCDLISPEGKYVCIVEIFESWFAKALQTREQRKLHLVPEGSTPYLIEGIGDGWKADSMVLERELTYSLREIKAFGSIQPGSSLGQIRSLYMKLILDMIEEIDTIQSIENEINLQETLWTQSNTRMLASDINDDIGAMN